MSEIKKELVGNWQLVSMKAIGRDGSEIYPIGQNVNGFLQYLENDLMAVQLGSSMRANFKSGDHRLGQQEEIIEAFNGYIAYYGAYKIFEERGYIIHDIYQSLYPNWIGKKNKRFFEIEDNVLTLSSVDLVYYGIIRTPTLIWQKM